MTLTVIHNYSMDTEEGIDFFRQLVKNSIDPELHFEFAVMLHDHSDKDYSTEIFEHLRFASDRGHADATNLLGHCYRGGIGVEKDLGKAVECYIRSAEMGSPDGCFSAGNELLMGKNIEPDYKRAYGYLTTAAEADNHGAINTLAIMHLFGYHVKRDKDKAKRLFLKAAKMGNLEAKHNLDYLKQQGKDYDPSGASILLQEHDSKEAGE